MCKSVKNERELVTILKREGIEDTDLDETEIKMILGGGSTKKCSMN